MYYLTTKIAYFKNVTKTNVIKFCITTCIVFKSLFLRTVTVIEIKVNLCCDVE